VRRRKPARPVTEPDLGPAIAAVTDDYMAFLRAAADEVDSKAFGAKHAAAKAALSHIEQLRKLSGDAGGEAAEKLDEYQALLGDIRRDMSAEPEEMPSDDDGDPG
jgi:hypothetical protein